MACLILCFSCVAGLGGMRNVDMGGISTGWYVLWKSGILGGSFYIRMVYIGYGRIQKASTMHVMRFDIVTIYMSNRYTRSHHNMKQSTESYRT